MSRDRLSKYCENIAAEFSTVSHLGGALPTGVSEPQHNHVDGAFIPVPLAPVFVPDGWTSGGQNPKETFLKHRSSFRQLVVGLPGSGKTTLLRYLAYLLARLHLEGVEARIPVLIRLGEYEAEKNTVAMLIQQSVSARTAPLGGADAVLQHAADVAVVLMDGLDEIESGARPRAIRDIEAFAREHPSCSVVVTSRHLVELNQHFQSFDLLQLQPLTAEMIDAFLRNWFGPDSQRTAGISRLLTTNARIGALGRNPFILSMICAAYDEKAGDDAAIIKNRSQLYRRCTEHLIRRLYARPNVAVRYEDTISLLKEIAVRFFLWHEQIFPMDFVTVVGARALGPDAVSRVGEMLDELQRGVGLIQRFGDGYTFVHKSLWEYFAALGLIDREDRIVLTHAGHPDWEEVIRLYTGLMVQHGRDPLAFLRQLWAINRPLALRCAGEIGRTKELLLLAAGGEGKTERILLIDSLERSLHLVQEPERQLQATETLRSLLIDCEERDCEVIFRAELCLDRMGLQPLTKGGILYELFDLGNAALRQQMFVEDPSMHFTWVRVEGGDACVGEDDQQPNEAPARQLTIPTFDMATHPVINRLARHFGFGIADVSSKDADAPVVGLTWFEARYLAFWLGCRLPREHEWEYAARGGRLGQRLPYYFDHTIEPLSEHIWFSDPKREHPHAVTEVNPRTGKPHQNAIGLCNMLGNVWEWCEERYDDPGNHDFHSAQHLNDARIMRGGTFRGSSDSVRCGRRVFAFPSNRGDTVGVRLVRDPGGTAA